MGLRGEKIEEFNENLLGLRGLILLAAAPNVGKTALTVQTAIDVLKTEKDACVVYFSLEMTEQQILIRMLMHLSRLEYSTLVSGSQTQQNLDEEGNHNFYTLDEQKSLASAKKTFSEFGNRLQIIDLSICPNIDAKTAINYVEEVKQKTGCSRAFVVVDYLQVWPINSNHRLIENEVDKYRIGEMKKIRDALDNDPVLVISEARKPNKEDVWGGDLADVMGSARGTYTPDVVMLLSQIQPKAMATLWNAKKLPMPPVPDEYKDKADKEGLSIIAHLAKKGISICELKVPKCRDGMKKFTTFLTFHFTKNEFKSTSPDWGEFKEPASSKSHF